MVLFKNLGFKAFANENIGKQPNKSTVYRKNGNERGGNPCFVFGRKKCFRDVPLFNRSNTIYFMHCPKITVA